MPFNLRDRVIDLSKQVFPSEVRDWVVQQQKKYRIQWPRMGSVNFGDLRRLSPISPIFALDRGQPIERYYIAKFLEQNRADIKGRAMELGDPYYINKYGTGVTKPEVLHYVEGNPQATLVADLTDAPHLETDSFDCIIFTQTLQMIVDMQAALRTIRRILKPGGVLLLTSHGISKIGRRLGRDDWGEYWHLTTAGADELFKATFPKDQVDIDAYGNVFTACCALHGLAAEEIYPDELDHQDPDFEVIVTVRAQKI